MRIYVYLDTNAFRYLGAAFEKVELPHDLKERMLHSPLTAFEVMKQLADLKGDEVLHQIHAIRNWTDAQHAGLLPASSDAVRTFWFNKRIVDDDFTKGMQESFNVCLNVDSPVEIQAEAVKHREFMLDLKLKAAQAFQSMLTYAKSSPFNMTEAWFRGVAKSIGADPQSRKMEDIVAILSAYHEYEQSKLQAALGSKSYNPLSLKNQNDIIDAEQLVYLGNTSLRFLTCDRGFGKRVKKSVQAARIITSTQQELTDPQKAEALLRKITQLS